MASTEAPFMLSLIMIKVVYAEFCYAGCHLYRVSFMLSVIHAIMGYAEWRIDNFAEYHYAKCHYTENCVLSVA